MLGKTTVAIVFLALVACTAASSEPKQDVNFCQGCRSIVSFVRSFNSSTDRDENKEVFKNFCELYYPASTDFQQGPCPTFVEGLFYVIDHIDPVQHCDQIGACGSVQPDSFKSITPWPKQRVSAKSSQLLCQFCEQLVEQTQLALTDPNVIRMVKTQVDAFCDYLSVVGEEKECKQLVNNYIDQAIAFVKQIDPLDYCRSIKLCNPTMQSTQNKRPSGARLPTLIDFNDFGIETSVTIGERAHSSNEITRLSSSKPELGGPNCMICKVVVKEMFNWIRNNKTEANIMQGLDKVCQWVYPHKPELDQCESMVKAYTRELIQLLIDETDPQLICMLLEQCGGKQNRYPLQQQQQQQQQQTIGNNNNQSRAQHGFGLGDLISALDSSVPVGSARACVECKMFIAFLRDKLEDPKSEDHLRDWLVENLCKQLGDNDLSRSCTKMVNDYSKVLFESVIGLLDPQQACMELQVCKSAAFSRLIVDNALGRDIDSDVSLNNRRRTHGLRLAQRAKAKNQLCDQCVDIVKRLDDYLSKHSVDQDVNQLIEQVCDKIPNDTAKKECTFLVKSFGTEIVQLIAQMDNPKELCSKLMLCSTSG